MALSGIFGYKLPNISQFSASSGPPPLTTFLKPCAAHRKATLRVGRSRFGCSSSGGVV